MNERGIIVPVLLGLPLGLLLGIGVYTFGYARGASYLTDNPGACVNCHVMREQYEGWLKSSHHEVAVCNDCHTPPGLIPKYFTKGLNGFNHSLAFTTGWFPDAIRITARNRGVTDEACAKCHLEIREGMRSFRQEGEDISCIVCHGDVGHTH